MAPTPFKGKMSCLLWHTHKATCLLVTSLKCLFSEIPFISETFSPWRDTIEDEKEEKPDLERVKQELKKILKVSYT